MISLIGLLENQSPADEEEAYIWLRSCGWQWFPDGLWRHEDAAPSPDGSGLYPSVIALRRCAADVAGEMLSARGWAKGAHETWLAPASAWLVADADQENQRRRSLPAHDPDTLLQAKARRTGVTIATALQAIGVDEIDPLKDADPLEALIEATAALHPKKGDGA